MASRSSLLPSARVRSGTTLTAALAASLLVGGLVAPGGAVADEGDWSATQPVRVDYVPDIAVDVADSQQVYAAYAGGVARSENGGQEWLTAGVDAGFDSSFSPADVIETDPTTPDTVYVGGYRGLYKSTNGGVSFVPIGAADPVNLDNMTIMSLAVDGGAGPNDTRLLVGDLQGKIWFSGDSGATWTEKTSNFTGSHPSNAAILHPTNPDVAIVVRASQVWRTVNLTAPIPTWTQIQAAPVTGQLFASTVTGNGTLVIGGANGAAFRSVNALTAAQATPTWSAVPLPGGTEGVTSLDAGPDGAGPVLAATGSGVFKTGDITANPVSWSELGGGLPGNDANAVAIAPSDVGTVYTDADGTVYQSTNGGTSFAARPGIVGSRANDVASAKGTTYAATTASGVLRTTNGGLSWTTLAGVAADDPQQAVAAAPGNPNVVLIAGELPGGGDGVRRSDDGGATFDGTMGAPANVRDIVFDPATPGLAYAVGLTNKVAVSDDGGQTWTQTANGIPAGWSSLQVVVVPDGAGDGVALAVTDFPSVGEAAVYASADRGASWAPADTGLPDDVQQIAADPTTTNRVLAVFGCCSGGVWQSTNAGGSWTELAPESEFTGDISGNPEAIAISPIDGRVLIAVREYFTHPTVLASSTDGGATFAPTTPFPDQVFDNVQAITFDPGGKGVHVASNRGLIDLAFVSDMKVGLTGPSRSDAGQAIEYVVKTTAGGPDPSTAVITKFTVPSGSRVVGLQGAGCTKDGRVVTCRYAELADDVVRTAKVKVKHTDPGKVTVKATTKANQADPLTGNNTKKLTTTVAR